MTKLRSAAATIAVAGILTGFGALFAGATNAAPLPVPAPVSVTTTTTAPATAGATTGARRATAPDRYSTDNGGLAYQRR